MQNSDFRTRLTSLHGSQPSSVFFGCKTAWFAPEWQDYIGSSPHLWFCACKTAPLGLELQVSVGQRPHLCFFHAKQRLYDQTYKSVGVPALTCGFCMQNSDFRTWLTSLHGSQTSSVVLSTHNSVLSTRINWLYWFQPSPVVLWMQNSDFRARITSLCGSKTPPVVFACKTASSGPE